MYFLAAYSRSFCYHKHRLPLFLQQEKGGERNVFFCYDSRVVKGYLPCQRLSGLNYGPTLAKCPSGRRGKRAGERKRTTSASESSASCSSCCHSFSPEPDVIHAWSTLLSLAAPLSEAEPQLPFVGSSKTQTQAALPKESESVKGREMKKKH